jgi:hypothetical protein
LFNYLIISGLTLMLGKIEPLKGGAAMGSILLEGTSEGHLTGFDTCRGHC